MAGFSIADVPSQKGRIAVITGTGGLGYETALVLAGKGADIIVAGRNARKGAEAVAAVKRAHPDADIAFAMLDLASLTSVAEFAQSFAASHQSLDILVNNAAVMSLPHRQSTQDGFEMQFGTNYLGHFALTAHLLPLLRSTHGARIVGLSSLAHRGGRIDFRDLQAERSYRPWAAYQQSKLAMLIFSLELQRRSEEQGWGFMSNAAHPGYARTDLIPNGPGYGGAFGALSKALGVFLSHSAAAGALPTLFAATSSAAKGGAYYGPQGFYELKGPPGPAHIARRARDRKVANRLWEASEKLTGLQMP